MPSVRNGSGGPGFISIRVLCVICAGVALVLRARHLLLTSPIVGHDYGYFLPWLVVGDAWIRRHGWWTIPDFTPAFCGGVPFLANPQSVFYSLPQLLERVFPPMTTAFLTLVVMAAVGALGTYLLLRRSFRLSSDAATLGAVLFFLNGFLFYRVVIGHLTYHTFGLVPLLAFIVLQAQEAGQSLVRPRWWPLAARCVAGGSVVAYATFGGGLNFQIPIALSVTVVLLLYQHLRGFRAAPWLVLAGAGVWGALLSAVKLAPAAVLAAQFTRSYLPDYLFASPIAALSTLLKGLFLPRVLDAFMHPNPDHPLGRHEFELGVSVVPVLLMLGAGLAGLAGLIARRTGPTRRWRISLPLVAVCVLCCVPLALSTGSTEWGQFLLRVPVINNNTTFVRWWSVYVLPLIAITALCLDRLTSDSGRRLVTMATCCGIALVQFVAMPMGYYTDAPNLVDVEPVLRADVGLRRNGVLPSILALGNLTDPAQEAAAASGSPVRRNEAFSAGLSSWPCYEPLFGYGLELMPPIGLEAAPIFEDGPTVNLTDPTRFFGQHDFSARSWRIRADRRAVAEAFVRYDPLPWRPPLWRRMATWITLLSLGLSGVVLGAALWRPWRAGAERSPS